MFNDYATPRNTVNPLLEAPASIKTLSAGLSEQPSQLFHRMISQHTRMLLIWL